MRGLGIAADDQRATRTKMEYKSKTGSTWTIIG